ncbi:hypothetical protein EDB81DRAFT_911543 [Dactylonectria macrodidyma]|uniref:Uncharacterized protein n=1 Tax=Dactylonectria macrodidyma TaxID=307937 RepID=A0A9P9IMK1_9HYPO|nr:hypothetical protein EDB81DRAFT_911543 [Dactylonectria macrodidyma]
MNEDESEQLLRVRLKGISTTSADLFMLSFQLEHLPLALAQGAAFIQETSITMAKYLRLLRNSDKDIVHLLSKEFETVGCDYEASQAVAQTWILSFQQIERQHALASELLSFICRSLPLETVRSSPRNTVDKNSSRALSFHTI